MVLENALLGVLLISVSTSFLISVIYKIFMDQEELKNLKKKMKELQEKSKEAREKGQEDEAMEHTQEIMSQQSKMFKMQMKPMAVTFIVIIPIFWLVLPGLYPSATVDVNGPTNLEYMDIEREVELIEKEPLEVKVNGKVLREGDVFEINDYKIRLEEYVERDEKLEFLRVSVELPLSLPFFGSSLGWLGWYIIVSLGFSQLFRKLLGAR